MGRGARIQPFGPLKLAGGKVSHRSHKPIKWVRFPRELLMKMICTCHEEEPPCWWCWYLDTFDNPWLDEDPEPYSYEEWELKYDKAEKGYYKYQ